MLMFFDDDRRKSYRPPDFEEKELFDMTPGAAIRAVRGEAHGVAGGQEAGTTWAGDDIANGKNPSGDDPSLVDLDEDDYHAPGEGRHRDFNEADNVSVINPCYKH